MSTVFKKIEELQKIYQTWCVFGRIKRKLELKNNKLEQKFKIQQMGLTVDQINQRKELMNWKMGQQIIMQIEIQDKKGWKIQKAEEMNGVLGKGLINLSLRFHRRNLQWGTCQCVS